MAGLLVAKPNQLSRLSDVNAAAKADQYGLVWDQATGKHVYVALLTGLAADYVQVAATDASSYGFVVDEDNLASDLDTKVPTQQSVKAYVDSVIAGLTALEAADIDTLAEINAIIGDATLVTVEATDASGYGWVIDEDDMTSDSATKVPTQQSVKAYVDAEIAGVGGGSGGLTVTAKTAGYTAANGDLVVCDSSGGAFNVTMPASPTADDRIGIYLEDGSAAAAVTVQGNGKVLAEFGTAVTLQTPGDVIVFQYDGAKWAIAANGIQTYSLSLLAAGSIDEDADYIRLADGDASEDYEKRATVKTMLAPYIEDSTLGTDAGDLVYRPVANDHWTNRKIGTQGQQLVVDENDLPAWGSPFGVTTLSDGATVTLDMAAGQTNKVTLGGNRTLALTNPLVGQSVLLQVVQDGTGSRTLSYPASVKWPGGTAPTLTTTAGASDWLGFKCVSASPVVYHGFVVGQGYAA
jgi:hypothetical protein